MADSVPDPGVLEERVAGLAEVVNKLIGVVSRLGRRNVCHRSRSL
ncbi:MAG TPA: hypothetical protein VHR38_10205 [Solirubrobacterales bacterium]|jgi:hypothetical protein|nr:hypothetical protein [Solirubrobacterales bacterium]